MIEQPLRNYRGDFEVHLTISAVNADVRNRFRDWCHAHHFKCVWIVLARGDHADQPMATWRRGRTILPVVLDEANRFASELSAMGIAVTRVKIETAPFNDEIPIDDADAQNHPDSNYFEHHIKLRRGNHTSRDMLLELCGTHGAHLSRNAFRDTADGYEERFVTLRCYGVGATSSTRKFEHLRSALQTAGEQIIDDESEYCVYDSHVNLDAGWLSQVI